MANPRRIVFLAFFLVLARMPCGSAAWKASGPNDVLPEYNNAQVTQLVEDCESVRLALGAAWDDALACRSLSGYLQPWSGNDSSKEAEAVVKRGARMYELVKCIDDGIESVRLARDSRDEPRLLDDVKFWRNELALAAREVVDYAAAASTLEKALRTRLAEQAAAKGISSEKIKPMPWADPQREAWRQAGPMTGVRLALDPDPRSPVQWWNQNLSVGPGYLVRKLCSAGDQFISPERPIGAWGCNATGKGQYDWTSFNRIVQMVSERRGKFLLELPTLTAIKTDAQIDADVNDAVKFSWWAWQLYAPALPKHLETDPSASLTLQRGDATTAPFGGVQLFNPEVAQAYGEYLKAMAANLKAQRLYDAVAAIHLEMGDSCALPDNVDYSEITAKRWQKFLAGRYGTIEKLNQAAGTTQSFDEIFLPPCKFLSNPPDGPPALQMDYLHFRRAWVRDYLATKRKLVESAFPDKLIIAEMRQFGDHDGLAGVGEAKWGGFLGDTDDLAQWSSTGPENEKRPFMIRSVGPPGFGTRPSDSIESLFRDYLWINFRDPGNLTRFFYDWVAHGYMDYQLPWHSVSNHWLSNRLVYQLGTTVANTAPKPQRIGLMLPRATFDLFEGTIYYEYLGWDWLLGSAKLSYTRIDERFIRDGGLRKIGLEVLILPGARAMDAPLASEIARWVADGGLLIASCVPGTMDGYGRALPKPALADVLGAGADGTTSEPVAGAPLGITIPRGIFTGRWAQTTDRTPAFDVLKPVNAEVLAKYESGKPAILLAKYGKGRAVTIGYPFGVEAVTAERTSIGFYRTYTCFVREPQLVARTEWLRKLIVDQLGFKPEYGVDYADVERFKGKEADALGLSLPKGLSKEPGKWLYVRTVGDPRPDHEIDLEHETPDMALRFFPRHRTGLATSFLGISTREVHYISPRGAVDMFLARHSYRCRINNPRIQAIWDVARDVPVGFARDAAGVSFNVSLPSGHIMMLAISEKPAVQLFAPGQFPGREKDEVLARCDKLAGGKAAPAVANLTPGQAGPWLKGLADAKQAVLISYGQEANKAAAERLAASLRDRFGLDVSVKEQAATTPNPDADQAVEHWAEPLVFIGDEWTNNDMALHATYWNWGNTCAPHLPFTATYAWPGKGRAVISLSRRYALIGQGGNQVGGGRWGFDHQVRKVQDTFPVVRRKLHIAANGDDAVKAVDELIKEFGAK